MLWWQKQPSLVVIFKPARGGMLPFGQCFLFLFFYLGGNTMISQNKLYLSGFAYLCKHIAKKRYINLGLRLPMYQTQNAPSEEMTLDCIVEYDLGLLMAL